MVRIYTSTVSVQAPTVSMVVFSIRRHSGLCSTVGKRIDLKNIVGIGTAKLPDRLAVLA
jgi:hypothetical protein